MQQQADPAPPPNDGLVHSAMGAMRKIFGSIADETPAAAAAQASENPLPPPPPLNAVLPLATVAPPTELRRTDVLLEDVLGQGQFGQVCRGRLHTMVGRVKTTVPVAVKMINEDAADSKVARKSFLEEAIVTWCVWRALSHVSSMPLPCAVTQRVLSVSLGGETCDRHHFNHGSRHCFVRRLTPTAATAPCTQAI